jgi:hypothetical protein
MIDRTVVAESAGEWIELDVLLAVEYGHFGVGCATESVWRIQGVPRCGPWRLRAIEVRGPAEAIGRDPARDQRSPRAATPPARP